MVQTFNESIHILDSRSKVRSVLDRSGRLQLLNEGAEVKVELTGGNGRGQGKIFVIGPSPLERVEIDGWHPAIFFRDDDGVDRTIILGDESLIWINDDQGNTRVQLWGGDGGEIDLWSTSGGLPSIKLDGQTGKITLTGGIDPPYVSFSGETHKSIKKHAKSVEKHEKALLFWNAKSHRMEVYDKNRNKFYTMTGEEV